MSTNDLDIAHTLADAFNTLADEVQTLTDRRIVLEHKLRFAHEQVRKVTPTFICITSPYLGPPIPELVL